MPNESGPITQNRSLKRRAAAVVLAGASLVGGGLLAERGNDSPKPAGDTTVPTAPADTSTSTSAPEEPMTTTTSGDGVIVDPETGSGGVIETPESPGVTIPADTGTNAAGTNGASVEGNGPTAVVVTPGNPAEPRTP